MRRKSQTTKTSANPIWATEELAMELFTNQVLAGIATGAIYACMALAVVMIYQAIDHLNFAQGEMAMFSTFISWQLMQWGIPYWWAFLATLIISFAGGIIIDVTVLLLILLFLFFQYTRIGLAMRAAAALPESARLVGINTSWMIALGWGMASAIGAIAGILIAPVVFLEPNMMLGVLLYGFAAAVLGGLTSPLGAVVGGFLVGVFENLAGTYIPGLGDQRN